MKTIAFSTLIMLAPLSRAETVINVDDTVVRSGVRRFGIGLAQHNYYDSNQMMKELLFRNPGFEGLLFQSVVRLGGGATAGSAIEDQALTQWPSGFWDDASYEVIWSSAAAKGRTGTITHSLAPLRANPPSDPAGSAQGTTYLFADNDPARIPANGDYLVLRQTIVGGTGSGAATGSWNVTTLEGGAVASETTDLPPPPPGADPLLPRGRQCVRLTALAPAQQAAIAGQFDTLAGFIRFDGHFRLAFKARGAGGANRVQITVRRLNQPLPYLTKTLNLTADWTDYAEPFEVHEAENTSGTVIVEFATSGQSALLLDDVSLRQTNGDPANPTEFRDPVVRALRDLRPGILRYVNWQDVGNSLDNALAPVFARMRSGYSVYSTSENNLMPGLHEYLVLCEHLGAEPWYSVPVTFSAAEITGLMQYLAGPVTTPYGAFRAARGHPVPWSDVFPRIHLEFGNENWNNTAYRGAAISATIPCGNRASEMFSLVKTSPHYSATRFQCILGSQGGNPALTLQLHNASAAHDVITLAPYMSGRVDDFATNEQLFGALFAEPEWWSTRPSATAGFMRRSLDLLQASSRPVPVNVYEVNLHTTQGAITQPALDTYTPSLGAALAVSSHMLMMLREVNCRDQVFFSLAGHRYTWPDNSGRTAAIWGSLLDMGKTDRKRPHYHALQMLNDALAGDLLRTTHSGDDPTWDVTPARNRVLYTGAHHLQSHAFRDGNRRALVIFNLQRDQSLDVSFTGPYAPAGAVTLRRLTSGAITDNNETATVAAPTTTTLTAFDPAQPLTLPRYSMSLLTWTQSPRQAWRYQHFGTVAENGSAADDADPDGDKLTNLLEYALGTLPNQPTPPPWITTTDGGFISLSVAKNTAASGVTWSAESSDDLISWHSGQAITLIDGPGTFSVRDTVPMTSATRRFIRLRVTAEP